MDAVVLIRTTPRTGGDCWPGDVVEVRPARARVTPMERLAFYLLRVPDLPDRAVPFLTAQKRVDPDASPVRKRVLGCASDRLVASARSRLSNAVPQANLDAFFRPDRSQRDGDVPSVNWASFRDGVLWQKDAERPVTPEEVGDDA